MAQEKKTMRSLVVEWRSYAMLCNGLLRAHKWWEREQQNLCCLPLYIAVCTDEQREGIRSSERRLNSFMRRSPIGFILAAAAVFLLLYTHDGTVCAERDGDSYFSSISSVRDSCCISVWRRVITLRLNWEKNHLV